MGKVLTLFGNEYFDFINAENEYYILFLEDNKHLNLVVLEFEKTCAIFEK